jgi:hypothetical protein
MRWPAGDLSRDWFFSTEVNRAPESLRKCDAADGRLAARRLAILHSSYTTTADIDVHEGGTEGTYGRFAELRLLSAEGQPSVFLELPQARQMVSPGCAYAGHRLEFELKSDGHSIDTLAFTNFSGIRRSATGTLTHYRSLENL